MLVLVYGVFLTSGYLPYFPIDNPSDLTDGLAIFAMGGIMLSFAIKQLKK